MNTRKPPLEPQTQPKPQPKLLTIQPDFGVQLPTDTNATDLSTTTLPQYSAAARSTVETLVEHGMDVDITKEDKDVAAKLTLAYAEDPEATDKKIFTGKRGGVTTKRATTLTPAALLLVDTALRDFGQSVVESATQIRHLVTNKLIIETDNPDPRVRIRALELLGKISDVGLFSDKSEVTITHQSTEDLRDRLRSKLSKLMGEMVDGGSGVVIDGDVIDVESELGLVEPTEPKTDQVEETGTDDEGEAGAEQAERNGE